MYDVYIHHKVVMEYTRFVHKDHIIDDSCYNNNNMENGKYSDFLEKELPNLHNVQNPISKKALIKNIHELNYQSQHQEWGEVSRTRGEELRRLEKTISFNQSVKKNLMHTWKQIYQGVNESKEIRKLSYHDQLSTLWLMSFMNRHKGQSTNKDSYKLHKMLWYYSYTTELLSDTHITQS